jgi:hypothetical protein
MKTALTPWILPRRPAHRKTAPHSVVYPPGMNLLVMALACKPSGEAYTLEIDIQLPPNQLDLFDDVSSADLLIETASGTETFDLSGSSPGDRSELVGIDPLDEATVAIAGYDGGELIAFGRSEVLTVESGKSEVSILVARVDDFAWVGMDQEVALGAVAATGDGAFLLLGGASGRVITTSSDELTTLDTVWTLPVAPPSADFSLEVLTQLPPMDEETFEYGSTSSPGRLAHTATRLADGRILVTGGAAAYEDQSQTSDATWVFDPQTNSYEAGEPLTERRMMHGAVAGPTGEVIIFGGFGSAEQNFINPLQSLDLFDPDTGSITPITGSIRSGMVGAGAARLGTDGVLICGGLKINNNVEVVHSDDCDLIGVPAMASGLIWPGLVSMDDGGVMVTGGYIGEPDTYYSQGARLSATDEVWIYRDGSWSQAASMHNPRAQHAAVPLPDGRVLVAGGANEAGNYFIYYNAEPLACAEIYDPQTDSWTEVMTCNVDDAEASLPLGMVRPGFDADPGYGVFLAGGHNRDGDALSGAAYFVGQPEL